MQFFCETAFECAVLANSPIADADNITAAAKLRHFGLNMSRDSQKALMAQKIGSTNCANTNSALSGWQGIAVRRSRKASDAKVASINRKLSTTEKAGTTQRSNMHGY